MKELRFESLQVCRAIAALLVVLSHFSVETEIFLDYAILQLIYPFGKAGVSFFFVLSGFIICYTHWSDINNGSRACLKNYYTKRFTRLLPSYWTVLLIVSLLYTYFNSYSLVTHNISPIYFLKNMFFVSYDPSPIIVPAWTLQYEMLFYFFFAAFILRFELGLTLLFSWISFICIYNLKFSPQPHSFVGHIGSLYCLQFLIGLLVAYITKKWMNYIALKILLTIGILGFIISGLSANYYPNIPMTFSTIYAFFSALIILGLVKLETIRTIKFPSLFVFLGGASYSIYLTHDKIMSILFRISQYAPLQQFPVLRVYMLTFIILLTTIICSCLFYKYYELPMINFIRLKLKKADERKLIISKGLA